MCQGSSLHCYGRPVQGAELRPVGSRRAWPRYDGRWPRRSGNAVKSSRWSPDVNVGGWTAE